METKEPEEKTKDQKKAINWLLLKTEFMAGPYKTSKEFLELKGLDPNSHYYRLKASGWVREKKGKMSQVYERSIQRIFKKEEDEGEKAKLRHAAIARYMQGKGVKALEQMPVTSADEARKLVISGIDKEREAIGLDAKQKPADIHDLTQVNINLPNTKLDDLLEGLDYEGTLRLIAEVKRRRTVNPGNQTVIEGETETE